MSKLENQNKYSTKYKTVKIDDLDIFYREAGPTNAPTILLLHGFPTSSHMFRNLIQRLSDRFHLIAPDYPGYGNSSMPSIDEFEYTFENVANSIDRFIETIGLENYSLYMMDYGAPIGFRLFSMHPEKIQAFIIQNGNAYDKGLEDFWNPIKDWWNNKTLENEKKLHYLVTLETTKWQYINGTRNSQLISPDNWIVDQARLDRPGNVAIQLAMLYDYKTNPPLYSQWQENFRRYQPPTLIIWGKNDYIFPEVGAHQYKRDLKDVETYILDTGHFALEEDCDVIAEKINKFISSRPEIKVGVKGIAA
jgi:pimeloyl-ACP methyl ester carboxylesterase